MSTATVGHYLFKFQRLALGLEPLDALRGGPLTHPVRVDVEGQLPWIPKDPDAPYGIGRQRPSWPVHKPSYADSAMPRFDRHDSCRHVLLYQPGLADQIDIRIYDHNRRYVARRLRVPIKTLEVAETLSYTHRVLRPVLFPGAAGDVSRTATGLRGWVLREEPGSGKRSPIRWARIEARLPDSDTVVGRAHGDDRGEFLLLLSPDAAPLAELSDFPKIRVVVFGPQAAPIPDPANLPELDAYWDLPLEQLPDPEVEVDDQVSTGLVRPTGYEVLVEEEVEFQLGMIISAVEVNNEFLLVSPV